MRSSDQARLTIVGVRRPKAFIPWPMPRGKPSPQDMAGVWPLGERVQFSPGATADRTDLRRLRVLDELLDLFTQRQRLLAQLARHQEHLAGGGAGLAGGLGDPHDIAGDLLRAGRGLLDVAGDLLRCRLLL